MLIRSAGLRAGIATLAVLAAASFAAGDTFTWDGSVDRQWDTFATVFPGFDTNWTPLGVPGEDDIARFDGESPGQIIVGGQLGAVRKIRGLEFSGGVFEWYDLDPSSTFGGEIQLGDAGIRTSGTADHQINADLTLTADSDWQLDGDLTIAGKLQAPAQELTRRGDGLFVLDSLPEGSNIDRLALWDGVTEIRGGNLSINAMGLGNLFAGVAVDELRITSGAQVDVGSIAAGLIPADTEVLVENAGTRLTTVFAGRDAWYNLILTVRDGALVQANRGGGVLELDKEDALLVDRAQLVVGAIDTDDMLAGGSALRISDPGDGYALVIDGERDSHIRADISDAFGRRGGIHKLSNTKLRLSGTNTFSGALVIDAGVVELTGSATLGPGRAVRIAPGASLVTAASITRAIHGGHVEATDDVLLGDFASDRGFEVATLDVSGHDVVLLDQDRAALTDGVSTIAGGRLRTTLGLSIDANAALQGHGTVEGGLVNHGRIEGSGDGLVLNGLVSGPGEFLGTVIFNGLFEPGNSPATVTMGSPEFRNLVRMELGGLGLDESDRLRILGNASLDGTLEIELLGGFQPNIGDRFVLVEVWGSGALEGSFDFMDLPDLQEGLFWETSLDSRSLAVRVVPEPATITILGLAAMATLIRRKNDQRFRTIEPQRSTTQALRSNPLPGTGKSLDDGLDG